MLIYAVVRREPYEPDAYIAYYKDEDRACRDANARNINMPDHYWRDGTEYEVDTIIVEE